MSSHRPDTLPVTKAALLKELSLTENEKSGGYGLSEGADS